MDSSQSQKTAFVVGASGAIGKRLVRLLASSSAFSKVTLLGRRNLDLDAVCKEVSETELKKITPSCQLAALISEQSLSVADLSKFVQVQLDFDSLVSGEMGKALFAGHDVGFCTLGTTRGPNFYKVDHDYIIAVAKAALSGGCKHFNLLSSGAACKDSHFLYLRTKGEVEEELKSLGFPNLSIYRPSLLLVNRQERRIGEAIMQSICKPLDAWRKISIDGVVLASTMLANAASPPTEAVESFENAQCQRPRNISA